MSESITEATGDEGSTATDSPSGELPPIPEPVPPPPAVAEWARATAVPLTTVEAGNGFADMEPLRAVIGDARLVSLGEATHGTREFFQLKHRMLEFLVEEMGFTWFGIEAAFPDCMDLYRYVSGEDVDPVKALDAQRFWTWNTEEVLDLVRWMRAYNEDPAHGTKLRFYGYDMQSPTCATLATLDYLAEVDPALKTAVEGDLTPLADDYSFMAYGSLPSEVRDRARQAVERVLDAFDENRDQWAKATGETEFALASLHARVVAQAEEHAAIAPADELYSDREANRRTFALRDQSMAENIRTISELEGPGSKGVLWAHNGHVQRTSYANYGVTSMGGHLHEMFGDEHVVVGFAFNQGSFQAIEMGQGLTVHEVGPAKEHSLDAVLAAALDYRVAALDLRSAPADVAAWLASGPASRSVGSVYAEVIADHAWAHNDLTQAFDVLLFVESTTAAIPSGGRPAPPKPADGSSQVSSQPSSPPELPDALVNGDLAADNPGSAPSGWHTLAATAAGYDVTVVERDGRRALEITPGPACQRWSTANLTQVLSPSAFAGRRARLSATVAVTGSARAYLSLAADGPANGPTTMMMPPQPLASEGMHGRPIRTEVPTEYSIEIDVPPETTQLRVAITAAGQGTATVSDVRLDAV